MVAELVEANTMDDINQQIHDRKFLLNKGIMKYSKRIPKEKLDSRMIYGSFDKRSKGNVKYWMKRWLLLVSSRPLKHELYI